MVEPCQSDGPVAPNFIGAELCRVLGLEANRVLGLSIHLRPGQVAFVTVKHLLLGSQVPRIVEIIERHKLVERELVRKDVVA